MTKESRGPLQALWMFLLSSPWLTSSRAPPCAKWISTVGKRLYVNALTESERLNDTEYRSETCSEAKLIVIRPERTEPLRGSVLGRTYKTNLNKYKSVYFTCFVNKIEILAIFFTFNTNPGFPPFLLYVRCKSRVTFIRRSFHDALQDS